MNLVPGQSDLLKLELGFFLFVAGRTLKLVQGLCTPKLAPLMLINPCTCVFLHSAAKTDRAFKEFLDARNPNQQHSSTLESYLIKPVQRVLKYPLLLRELVSLTDGDSEEHYHLTGTYVGRQAGEGGRGCQVCVGSDSGVFTHLSHTGATTAFLHLASC